MGPVPGVRRTRGGLPGRPGGVRGLRVGPCPDGPRPGCPGRLPWPSRGSGAPARVSGGPGEASQAVPGVRGPGSGPAPMGPGPGVRGGVPGGGVRGLRVGPCPDGPRPGCPGRLPRPSRGSGAPARVSGGPGEASQAVPEVRGPGSGPAPMGPGPGVRGGVPGGQGPRVGPCPDGPPPGCPGRLPRLSRGSGAPGRALPRWAPSRVSGEASQAVPGVRGPGSGPPILQAALPRRAPARVSGGPGESSPAVPGGQGPRPGCPGDASPALPGVRGPGSGPAPMGPLPGVRGGFPGRPGGQGPGSGPAPKGPGPGVRGPGSVPAPMGPVPGVRGGFPGRPGGQGPRVGPCPDGPRPRCPGPRVGPCPDGPPPGCPGRLPRPSRGSGAPGRALPSSSLPCPAPPRWAPGRAGPPSLPCPDGPRPVPQGPRRLREPRQSASRWPPSEPGHLASPRTRGIWSPSALICYGASRWPGCPESPDEGSFAPSCPARAPGGRVRSRRRSPPSLGAHQLPGRAQIFLRITRDRVRRTPSWSGGPVVLDRAPRARVARPPPRTLVRWVSPPNLAAQRADCRPGSSQHRTPIDWAHLVRLGMDCLAPGTVRLAGPPFLGRPFPAERRPSSPAACALPAVRPEWREVGWRQVPGSRPPRRSGHPSAVARLLLHPAHFPQQLGTTVLWGVPAGPGRQAPPASPAQAAPRPGRLHPAEAAGARRFPCDRPAQGGPRQARGYSPQQVRLPG
ncbi:hypothetical protein NDU88_007089 [Pleurodeles waltl]|uniref:Uncharacterized protein n=1 Tax=Pleurodeles waltl TaxID=8319 RepID=A0AAV7PLH8_PLEWA|nr:hypothetical protein NDU88_007089 [Pleurodeles waltl]